jgi:hypothetical protein
MGQNRISITSVVCLEVMQLSINKYLSLQDRITIENMLNRHCSLKEIGARIGKDCTTVSKEIRIFLKFTFLHVDFTLANWKLPFQLTFR